MTKHHTKTKGDLATAKTVLSLTQKGYSVFFPAFSEHLPFDLIAYKNGKSLRVQVKYSTKGYLAAKCTRKYEASDFDYYALYIPQIDKVIFPSIKYRGAIIRHSLPNSVTPFYWWKDFVKLTSRAEKRTLRDFGKTVHHAVTDKVRLSRLKRRKVKRPSAKKLKRLMKKHTLTALGEHYGVSGNAVKKWAKSYGLL